MTSFKAASRIVALIVFIFAAIVYFLTAERTGSLWDCGEFILGAYKLQVVHPPGAPLFLLVGRIFAWIASVFSSNPENIAFSVNMMSGLFTAAGAGLVAKIAMIFGKRMITDDANTLTQPDLVVLSATGLVGGLTTAFCTSIWFSAVEGEVYGLSTFFTILTFWAAVKWYDKPDVKDSDRWLVFSIFAAGLSSGVHLLSLLTFPAIALLYYFKKHPKPTFLGVLASLFLGMLSVVFVMKTIIVGIPTLWQTFEIPMVNSLGLPLHSGAIMATLVLGGLSYFLLNMAHKRKSYLLQLATVSIVMVIMGFSTLGVVVIRANADTPINMNVPSDVTRLIPYLNREQYGERPLLFGPTYEGQPLQVEREDRYGIVNGKYEIVDEKFSYKFDDKDKILFPRIGHGEKAQLHEEWRRYLNDGEPVKGKPGMGYNLSYMWNYQFNWMYWRYFNWNFVGRQNGDQGYFPWDKRSGHWISGITPLDDARLYDSSQRPDSFVDQSTNKYYFIPLLLGLLGFFFHFKNRPKEFMALLILFLITGLGIILYSNQPPNEPRERDYVLAGSFFAFSIWVGLGATALYQLIKQKMSSNMMMSAGIAASLAIVGPMIMLVQNFDDNDRSEHYGSRDYASNFLESCEPNSIIFTYGDNDTYPLWYAQEVENIRTDVRVINLSLIAVDWYIEKMRWKVNNSNGVKMTIPTEAYRGIKRNQLWFMNENAADDQVIDLPNELRFIASDRSVVKGKDRKGKEMVQYTMRSRNLTIPVSESQVLAMGMVDPKDSLTILPEIEINFPASERYVTKAELAMMDILTSNINERPIYFATTSNPDKLMGMNDYMQLEGLGLRLIPVKSKSNKELYIYGYGRVDSDQVYDNVMNKWKWGNFDKEDLYINPSYGAEIQAMKMVMLRACVDLSERGKHEKAAALANKFFDSFPNFNFEYDSTIFPFIDVLIRAKDYENAKKHIRILAEGTKDKMYFYESLDENDFTSFRDDFQYSLRSANDILRSLEKLKDEDFINEMNDLIGEYDIRKYREAQKLKN